MGDQDDTIKNNEHDDEEPEEERGEKDQKEEIDWEGRYKRALADYQNLEKRVAKRFFVISIS